MWSGLALSGFLVSVLTVTVWQASAQAPGDEDNRCTTNRANAGDVYPPFTTMLMDSRNYEDLISGSVPHWQALDVDGTGFGWTSTLGGLCAFEPRSCDYAQSASQENWFFTQYISYLQAREVFVNFSATFTECRLASSCNQLYVDMYRYERNERDDVAARTTSNYQQLIHIEQPSGWPERVYRTSFTFTPSVNFNGFYIGVRANGTCVNIQRIQIFYRASLTRTVGLVIYPEIALPVLGSTASVTGLATCAANSNNLTSLLVTCFADGRCEDIATCTCNPGYEYMAMASVCTACPAGTFQPYNSNSTNTRACMACPANSTATQPASAVCPCDFGVTRNSDRPEDPCTRPPSSPRIATANPPSVVGNVLRVCWLQSRDSGGGSDLHYNIYTLEAGDTMYTRVSTVRPMTQNELVCDSVELNAFTSYSVVVTAASGATNDPSTFSDVSVVQDRFIVFYVATCAAGLSVAAAVSITFFVTLICTAVITSVIVVAIFLFLRKSSAHKSTSSSCSASNSEGKPPRPPRPVVPYPSRDGGAGW